LAKPVRKNGRSFPAALIPTDEQLAKGLSLENALRTFADVDWESFDRHGGFYYIPRPFVDRVPAGVEFNLPLCREIFFSAAVHVWKEAKKGHLVISGFAVPVAPDARRQFIERENLHLFHPTEVPDRKWGICISGPGILLVDVSVWPAEHDPRKPAKIRATVGAETRCAKWLTSLGKRGAVGMTKGACREEALRLFAGLTNRGFDRVWREAAPKTWTRPGRRAKNHRENLP